MCLAGGFVGAFSFTLPSLPPLPPSLPPPIQHDKEGRQYVKQEVIDALIKDNRFLNETVPLSFYEKDQRRLSFKGASKVRKEGREGGREGGRGGPRDTKLMHPSPILLADNRVPPRASLRRRPCS